MIKRGMLCFCLSLLLGILYGRHGGWWFLLVFLSLLILMAAAIWHLLSDSGKPGKRGQCQKKAAIGRPDGERQNRKLRIWCAVLARVALCTTLFVAGTSHVQAMQEVRDRLERSLSDGDAITVMGRICRKEESDARGSHSQGEGAISGAQAFQKKQFIYYLRESHVSAGERVYPCHGILVYSSNGGYRPGNIIKADGRYVPFQISRNEGNFNQRQYQQSRKWEFRVYADSETLLSQQENKYAVFLGGLRAKMKGVFVDAMDDADAGLMADMALGEKSLLDPEVKALYQDAGISHILAISGLHVSILGMGLLSFLQRLGCNRKWSAILAAAIVCSFCIFSGMEVSTVRAVGMFLLMMAAQVLGRSYDSITALCASAAVQLWNNPFLPEYAGFLFSYGAVLGVVVVWKIVWRAKEAQEKERRKKETKRRREEGRKCGRLQQVGQKLCDIICVSVCIQLATLPLTLYFYYEVPVYGVFVNACILPFVGILLFLGFAGGLLGILFPALGAVILTPAGWLLAFNEAVCTMAGKLPFANFIAGKPPVEMLFAYYSVLGVCLYLIWRRGKTRYLWGIVLMLACLLFVRGNARFEVDVLDVGQGDGILVQNENGEHFFVDGGSSDVASVGKYRILPFLKSRKIRSVKGWIVSHADADHVNGLMEILQQGYPVETLILARDMVRDEAMESLLQAAKEAECQVMYVSPGMRFGSGSAVFTVLAPNGSGEDRNASSLSVLLEHPGFTGVFTGDIGTEQEQELAESGDLARYGAEDVDFYKAAHHGSDYSNSQKFLGMISPKITVVSCGKKNSYGHPGRKALERIQETGSRVFLTMEQGQVCIQPGEEGIRVWTYLP